MVSPDTKAWKTRGNIALKLLNLEFANLFVKTKTLAVHLGRRGLCF